MVNGAVAGVGARKCRIYEGSSSSPLLPSSFNLGAFSSLFVDGEKKEPERIEVNREEIL